ncbi:hypothetical protein BCV70DRAFT_227108 [Testicularia cyperi]|uniref:Diphthamide biosynthesis protein n=1 Tax=Testicularia cyperi TaxID=1882483 RepID=A0A317XRA3_9BASI|nr:hypothetical protein BCV70DRAFT_227108 [Testicularia cyperi]
MAAFSTTDEAILTAPLELNPVAQAATASSSGRSIYHIYDIESTAAKIVEGRFQRVALQFPDEALVDSVPVFWALKREIRAGYEKLADPLSSAQKDADETNESSASATSTNASPSNSRLLPELYILADTSYGSCCVDEVAARHVNADLVVHYGHACLSNTATLPVIYVFTKQPLDDVQRAAEQLVQSAKEYFLENEAIKALVLTYDVSWDHAIQDVYEALQACLKQHDIQLPLVRSHVDTRRNYQDKVGKSSIPTPSPAPASQSQDPACDCAKSASSGEASACGNGMMANGADNRGGCCSSGSSSNQGGCCNSSGTCVSGATTSRTSLSVFASSKHNSTEAVHASVEEQRRAQPLGPSRTVELPSGVDYSDCGYLYVGPESLSLTNLLLTLGATTSVVSYDPLTGATRQETGRTNKLLMKRYTSVLKARDASVVGLLVGTLGVQSYLPLLKHLRGLLTSKQSGRKVYTISVGKLNPAKLANFQEIDVFVLIACPENTLVDSKEFLRPIVTPFEMELAVKAGIRHQETGEEGVDWSGEYRLDLEQLVPEDVRESLKSVSIDPTSNGSKETSDDLDAGRDQVQGDEEDEDHGSSDTDQPHFSLISGTYVHRRRFDASSPSSGRTVQQIARPNSSTTAKDEVSDKAAEQSLTRSDTGGDADSHTVAIRNADGTLTTVLQSASMAHLETRTWKGLEQRLGLDEPSQLEEGREGIARGYKDAGGEGSTM